MAYSWCRALAVGFICAVFLKGYDAMGSALVRREACV